jgi:hypothetical protein
MTMSALIAIRLAEGVMGLTANERFHAVKQIDHGNVMLSRVFTIIMVVVLVCSVAALVIVSLCKKFKQRKAARKTVLENAAKKVLTASDTERYRVQQLNYSAAKTAFIAMFPTVKKAGLANGGGQKQWQQGLTPSPPGNGAERSRQLPEFLPATVTGLVGRVVFLETTLKANVGDRVLVVIGLGGSGETAQAQELIQDVGMVQQSAQPGETMKTPDSRRLSVALVGISEEQTAKLADLMRAAKTTQTAVTAQPVGTKEQSK